MFFSTSDTTALRVAVNQTGHGSIVECSLDLQPLLDAQRKLVHARSTLSRARDDLCSVNGAKTSIAGQKACSSEAG